MIKMEITLSSEQIKLVNIVEFLFVKADGRESGNLFYTTIEIFRKLQSFYPSDNYSPGDVCEVLIYMKHETINGGSDKIFWFLQDR